MDFGISSFCVNWKSEIYKRLLYLHKYLAGFIFEARGVTVERSNNMSVTH